MPVRNGQRWLSKAIDSALTQTFADFELLIIDDGSVDATPEILANYRARDPRVVILGQKQKGLVSALNLGLSHAQGALIARLDSDDVAFPERLQRQIEYLLKHPDVVLLGSWAQVIDEKGSPKHKRLQTPTDRSSLVKLLSKKNPFIHSSVMFRTTVARELGGYRPAFEAAEDYDLWLRLSEIGDVAVLPEFLIQYRKHDQSIRTKKALRGLFSVRLALLSSEARRTHRHDPASTLTEPPNWHAQAEGTFYQDSAKLFRFLELGDPTITCEAAAPSVDLKAMSRLVSNLTRGERKFAEQALINLIRNNVRSPNHPPWLLRALLFRLHPMRALRLLWQS